MELDASESPKGGSSHEFFSEFRENEQLSYKEPPAIATDYRISFT